MKDRVKACQIMATAFVMMGLVGSTSAWAEVKGGELGVTSSSPGINGLNAAVTTAITVDFDQPVDAVSVTSASFWAYGRWSGSAEGTLSVDGNTVTLTPDVSFAAGELVTVVLANSLTAMNGDPLRPGGYSFQFWTRAVASPSLNQQTIATMTTRTTPGEDTISYGGVASDLNNDGWLDLTIVNEATSDLRVFMNLADGSGAFSPFEQPTNPVGLQASPSETGDFNRDGFTDICVANIAVASVSILLGNGDGSYAPQQLIAVGNGPRGIAAFDIDGDGDLDVANTNSSSGNISILLNDGTGVFGAPSFIQGGISNEWSLGAADMNNDGLIDLVTASQSAQQIAVMLNDGDGTFTPQTPQLVGGRSWMLALGDVNGDGNADVSSANSFSNLGAMLLGDGAGGFSSMQTLATDPFPLATDLGDVDGDGDLDWITSSFSGDFRQFLNNGAGVFVFDREFDSQIAASCALIADVDNDLDMDLVLIDEIADVVMIVENDEPFALGDLDQSGEVDIVDLVGMLAAWGPCAACPEDLDADGEVGVGDLLILLANWS